MLIVTSFIFCPSLREIERPKPWPRCPEDPCRATRCRVERQSLPAARGGNSSSSINSVVVSTSAHLAARGANTCHVQVSDESAASHSRHSCPSLVVSHTTSTKQNALCRKLPAVLPAQSSRVGRFRHIVFHRQPRVVLPCHSIGYSTVSATMVKSNITLANGGLRLEVRVTSKISSPRVAVGNRRAEIPIRLVIPAPGHWWTDDGSKKVRKCFASEKGAFNMRAFANSNRWNH